MLILKWQLHNRHDADLVAALPNRIQMVSFFLFLLRTFASWLMNLYPESQHHVVVHGFLSLNVPIPCLIFQSLSMYCFPLLDPHSQTMSSHVVDVGFHPWQQQKCQPRNLHCVDHVALGESYQMVSLLLSALLIFASWLMIFNLVK